MTILTWIDFETTGLKPSNHRILEYAVVFTDLELNELGCLTAIIPQGLPAVRSAMDDYVTAMHTKNGLLEELELAEVNNPYYVSSIKQADMNLFAAFDSLKSKEETIFTIAGSNVLFDVKWMMADMPKSVGCIDHRNVIEGPESYRCLDVSGYKVGFPDIFKTATSAKHRAMDDIRASIAMHAKMRSIVEDAWKYEELA